ncbi:MAG: helix-turn-helix transcriptional regulator [Acidobacteriota bacterium]
MNRLKTLREAKGLTQHELSVQAGVDRNQISKWENADMLTCRLQTAQSLARVLGCSIDELLAENLQEPRRP